jgi:2C-methyl-D-erythritol 2,4-cyclodiphosphate synthase
MNKLQNLKTFFKEFKYLKKYFFQELNKMTSERLMVEHLAKYSAPLIKEHEYDPKKLEKYVEICEKKLKPYTPREPINKNLKTVLGSQVEKIEVGEDGIIRITEFKN